MFLHPFIQELHWAELNTEPLYRFHPVSKHCALCRGVHRSAGGTIKVTGELRNILQSAINAELSRCVHIIFDHALQRRIPIRGAPIRAVGQPELLVQRIIETGKWQRVVSLANGRVLVGIVGDQYSAEISQVLRQRIVAVYLQRRVEEEMPIKVP